MKLDRLFKLSIIGAVILTFLIYLASFLMSGFRETLLPDTGASWYYWKLPTFSLIATLTAWVCYLAHQITVWILLYKLKLATENKESTLKKSIVLLVVNLFFALLHILQSVLFYEGLAGTTPVFSSQVSVIIMLVFILILLASRRGLFFGKKVFLPKRGVDAIRAFHGIYIAWALIYTFWFHPTEGTAGHLLGFLYIFLLLIQLSLAYTKIHTNIKWLTFLEGYVAIHGAVVAIDAGNNMWQMFFFGFAMMFVVTGIYGITKSKLIVSLVSLSYLIGLVFVYSGVYFDYLDFSKIHQATWIPIILYALVFVLSFAFIPFGKKKITTKETKAE